ncbi:MAG: hypothetical protein ACE5GE_00830 [Phycisphaerae bacterium]
MPRPSKAVRQQLRSAAQAWKKGDRTEANKLWGAADQARKELQAKKRNKNKPAEPESPAAEAGEGESPA